MDPCNASVEGGDGGSKKRGPEDDDLEAELGNLVNKLGAVTTDNHETLVNRFVEVIDVDAETATFYLEASHWSLPGAVALHLKQDRAGSSSSAKRRRRTWRTLEFSGLPEGWSALATDSGRVVFRHATSGAEQPELPGNEMGPRMRPDEKHAGVTCDGCGLSVAGVRYQSRWRPNYDLCEECFPIHAQPEEAWLRLEFVYSPPLNPQPDAKQEASSSNRSLPANRHAVYTAAETNAASDSSPMPQT